MNESTSEHIVSRRTELVAQQYGVVLVKTDPAMDTMGHDHYVAIAFRGGRIVRSGHILWVTKELEKLKCKIIGIWEP